MGTVDGVTTTNAESFTLDAGSNLGARTGPSATYTLDGANRPTSDGARTFTWSAASRLTARGADSFGYDPQGRLTSSTVSGTARTYAYSGDGLLQTRTTGGTGLSLLWDLAASPQRLLQVGPDQIVYGQGPLMYEASLQWGERVWFAFHGWADYANYLWCLGNFAS